MNTVQTKTLTYFAADFHLGSSCGDDPRQRENRVVAWLDSIAPTAQRLVLAGDILDFWWEYRTVAPQGHLRFLGTLARMADNGTEIVWLKGNHDIWFGNYLEHEIGMTVIDKAYTHELQGKRFFVEHGDGVGRRPLRYRLLRTMFRSRWAKALYSSLHPRWALPIAHSWSSHSRRHGGYATPSIAPLREFAESHPGSDFYVFGHYHTACSLTLASGAQMVVLGDWLSLADSSYAVFDGRELRLCNFVNQ